MVFILGLTGYVLSLTIQQIHLIRAQSSLLACDCEIRNHLLPSGSFPSGLHPPIVEMVVLRISYVEDLNLMVWFGMTRRFRFAHAGLLSSFPPLPTITFNLSYHVRTRLLP
jgi:hypothetical protein